MTTKIQTENGRDYIPLPGEWQVLTKGNSSAFRIAWRGDSTPVPGTPFVHDFLERMARDINAEWNRLLGWIAELEAMEASLLQKVSKFSEEAAAAKVRVAELEGNSKPSDDNQRCLVQAGR